MDLDPADNSLCVAGSVSNRAHVSRFFSNGTLMWSYRMAQTGTGFSSVKYGALGGNGVFMGGLSTVSLPGLLPNQGSQDWLVAMVNVRNGSQLFVNTFGYTGIDQVSSIDLSPDGMTLFSTGRMDTVYSSYTAFINSHSITNGSVIVQYLYTGAVITILRRIRWADGLVYVGGIY